MSLFRVFDVSGSAMSAQSVRLNTTASNLANAESISSSSGQVYRARKPIFRAELDLARRNGEQSSTVGVAGIVESDSPIRKEYDPNHPMADNAGYIYKPNVNVIEEMTDMISASRAYQTNVDVATNAKKMLEATLRLGK